MRKLLKFIGCFMLMIIVPLVMVACGEKDKCDVAERVSLAKTILGEIEFENSENVKLEQDCDKVVVSGSIDAMTQAQVSEFGKEDATHVVVLKFEFDKTKTISSFEIAGEITKVYSTDTNAENYDGSISELLDNEDDEDAFCYLILSAGTKNYKLTSTYTDGTSSKIELEITATLVSAQAE